MKRVNELDLGREIVARVSDGSTPMTDDLYWNDASVYTDPEQHARELPVFFGRYPLVMGSSAQIPNPGDALTDDHTHIPILMVRGVDGRVRAFVNGCRHRGARLVTGDGDCGLKAITCPYHAWVYGLDGRLRTVPGHGFEGLDRSTMGLIELPCAERAGLIWVLPDATAVTPSDTQADAMDLGPMVDAHLGEDLLTDLDAYGGADSHLFRVEHLTRRLNWKLTLDTFFESYHFRALHEKTIYPLVRTDQAPIRQWGDHHLMVAVRHSASELANQPEDDWDIRSQTVLVYLVWPNTIFLYQRDHIELFRIFPGETVADSEIEIQILIPEDPDTTDNPESARRHWTLNTDLLIETADAEDFTSGATIQRSFESGLIDRVVYGRNEPLMQSWHRSLKRAMTDRA